LKLRHTMIREGVVQHLPYATAVLLVAAGLATHWGLLPVSGGAARQTSATRTSATGVVTQRPVAAQSVAQPAARSTASPLIRNDDTLAASALPTFTTVATADGVGGRHTFKTTRRTRGRYVLIWFTKLPPVSQGKYQAEIFNVVFRGWR